MQKKTTIKTITAIGALVVAIAAVRGAKKHEDDIKKALTTARKNAPKLALKISGVSEDGFKKIVESHKANGTPFPNNSLFHELVEGLVSGNKEKASEEKAQKMLASKTKLSLDDKPKFEFDVKGFDEEPLKSMLSQIDLADLKGLIDFDGLTADEKQHKANSDEHTTKYMNTLKAKLENDGKLKAPAKQAMLPEVKQSNVPEPQHIFKDNAEKVAFFKKHGFDVDEDQLAFLEFTGLLPYTLKQDK